MQLFLAIVNYFGVHFGGFVVNLFTILKLIAIGAIIILSFSSSAGNVDNFFPLWGTPSNATLISAIGVAMIATLWSYDGWNSLTYLAGEIKSRKKYSSRINFWNDCCNYNLCFYKFSLPLYFAD